MIKRVKTFAIAAMALLPVIASAQQKSDALSLRITRGVRDTVYSEKVMILGVTSPKAQVVVGNESVKVFKTGSWGWQGSIAEGDNSIIISAALDGNIISDTVNVFYSTQEPKERGPRRPQEVPVLKDTTLYVVTTDGAYLNYGSGTDRLGGAKVGFLDAGIPLEVVSQFGNLYKIKVSENRYFHIPVNYTEVVEEAPIRNTNTLNWSVTNMGKYDKVSIGLSERHPYTFRQTLENNAIIIDIFGVQCNSNWLTQKVPLGMVEYVDFEQVEYDVMRAKIYLKNLSWGTKVYYHNNTLTVEVKHTPKMSLKGMVIGIDAGHGGPSSTGAVSISGLKEKELNLDMAYTLKKELEKRGAKVVLSRADDSNVAMSDRKKIFIDNNVDLMISIHCNAGGSPFVVKGASTYYRHIHNRPLAEAVLNRVLELDGVDNFGLVGNFNFSLNAPIEYPNFLLETQFLSNLEDEERIADPAFRLAMMKKVVKGIEDYLHSF